MLPSTQTSVLGVQHDRFTDVQRRYLRSPGQTDQAISRIEEDVHRLRPIARAYRRRTKSSPSGRTVRRHGVE